MTDTSHYVLFEELENGICKVTLNRPKQMNAYTPSLCQKLRAALHRFQVSTSLRVMILTGAGKGFCAGGDVGGDPEFEGMSDRPFGHAQELRDDMHAVHLMLHRMDKPVIAMINGAAVSGGLALALMCDYRIAAESARLGDPAGRVGLIADEGGAWLFPRVMGVDRALRMMWLNEIYGAPEALRLGLVSEVVPDEELAERTLSFAAQLAVRAPLSVRMNKLMVRRGLESTLEMSLGDAALGVMYVNKSQDTKEGLAAFRAKRAPEFRGV